MDQLNLNKTREAIINKILERFEAMSTEEMDKAIIAQILEDRTTLIKKLIGIDEKDTLNRAGSGRTNSSPQAYNNIQTEINSALEKHVLPEIDKMIEGEKSRILDAVRSEFIDSGYIAHKVRSNIIEHVDDWENSISQEISVHVKENLLKELYEDTNSDSRNKVKKA